MATRRSKKGTPKKKQAAKKAAPKPLKRRRRLSRAKKNVTRRKRRLLLSQPNTRVTLTGRRRKTVKTIVATRDDAFTQAKDFLSELQPEGKSYLFVQPAGDQGYSTPLGDWQETYFNVDSRALEYLREKRDVERDELLTINIVMIETSVPSATKRQTTKAGKKRRV